MVKLTEAVRALREELTEAAQGTGSTIGPVNVEFDIQFAPKENGEFSIWITSDGNESGQDEGVTHKIAFTLTPHNNYSNGDVHLVSNLQR